MRIEHVLGDCCGGCQAGNVPVLRGRHEFLVATLPKIVLTASRIWRSAISTAMQALVTEKKYCRSSDTVHSPQRSADLYSLIEIAKAIGLEPCTYLHRVFSLLLGALIIAQIEAALPCAHTDTD